MKPVASWICLVGLVALGCGESDSDSGADAGAGAGAGGAEAAGGSGSNGGDDFASKCGQFARTYTSCVEAECDQIAAVRDQMIAYYTAACRAVEGNATQEQVYRMIAEYTCDNSYYTASVEQLINDGGPDGDKGLKRFCTGGPITPLATCTSRCATVTGCLTPQNPYSILIADAASCEYGCATTVDLGENIACLEQTACMDASCDED